MAYQTGTATDMEDLLDQLSTFLQAEGWTEDQLSATVLAVHMNDVYVQLKADTSTGHIGVYQSLGFNIIQSPGNHPDDSGNGDDTGPVDTQRRLSDVGNGPYSAYHFFASGDNAHMVLEYAPGRYRHLSFGMLTKVGDWTGGEYCCAHVWVPAAQDSLTDNRHNFLMDARTDDTPSVGGTVHAEDLPDAPAASIWGVVWGGATSPGVDGNGDDRANLIGGFREGFYQNAMGWLQANPDSGFVPMFPCAIYQRLIATPEEWRLLGYLPDIRFINIAGMAPGEEFTLDGDTWKVFPWVRKNDLQSGQEGSGHMGVAYLKVP